MPHLMIKTSVSRPQSDSGYAAFDMADGRMIVSTVSSTRREAREKAGEMWDEGWSEAKARGYRILPVNITPE